MTVARLGHMLGGVPYNTGMDVVNRLEASGLQAAANKAECIALGTEQVNIAIGMEFMSKYDSSGVVVMGEDLRAKGIRASDEIARKFGITRE
mmetsp:Transcript_22931/g.3778  ORF Transcript_22931/g.3778 Transcript_22931/m.3778 type:complete len:92 (-) Transcript_22931:676-951(-)|eukprot:CAMPEP_0168315900 /NCGR_PEP_ID=MMETSP0210-20121227/13205_1 /TAXON_ID=40633 /ORGANISM="Condylostoma magnum, Strain COL2" /LENGTH=91 /DNA_ID=CAMNT_0008292523 /DNA_START=243 /DNA_END=518 /DNA_ORIENTATION=-